MGFVVSNIRWEASAGEICRRLGEISMFDASALVGLSIKDYSRMEKDRLRLYVQSYFKAYPTSLAELLGLPTNIWIPDEFGIRTKDDNLSQVTSWIYDMYGRRVLDYELKEKEQS